MWGLKSTAMDDQVPFGKRLLRRAFSLVINFYPNVSAICVSAHSLSILHFHVSQNFHDFRSMLYDLCFFRFDLKNTVMSECCDFLGVSESKIFLGGKFWAEAPG